MCCRPVSRPGLQQLDKELDPAPLNGPESEDVTSLASAQTRSVGHSRHGLSPRELSQL